VAAFFCTPFDRRHGRISGDHVMAHRKAHLDPDSSNYSGTTPERGSNS
jgi:hypothetical protein